MKNDRKAAICCARQQTAAIGKVLQCLENKVLIGALSALVQTSWAASAICHSWAP